MSRDLTTSSYWDHKWFSHNEQKNIALNKTTLNKTTLNKTTLNKAKLNNIELFNVVRSILREVPLGGRLLELGGAPGNFVKRYFEVRSDLCIDCVDYSDSGVRATKDLYRTLGINGNVHLSDFRDFSDSHAGSYDIVTSHGLIEHFEDIFLVMEQHFKLVKRGGAVFITLPNYSAFPVKQLLQLFSQETVRTHNFSCMDTSLLKTCAEQLGASEIKTGMFGGSVLPHSAVDHGWGGKFYKKFSQSFNLCNTMLYRFTRQKACIRLWENQIYLKIKK